MVLFFLLEGQRNGRKISPQSLGILVKAKNAMLIDLRDAKDFREGHISGSRNIPYSQITKHVEELKTSDRPLVFVCNLGQVAGSALQQVGHAGKFTHACLLFAGIRIPGCRAGHRLALGWSPHQFVLPD